MWELTSRFSVVVAQHLTLRVVHPCRCESMNYAAMNMCKNSRVAGFTPTNVLPE